MVVDDTAPRLVLNPQVFMSFHSKSIPISRQWESAFTQILSLQAVSSHVLRSLLTPRQALACTVLTDYAVLSCGTLNS